MRRAAILALLLVARAAHSDDVVADDAAPRIARPYWLHGKLEGITAKLGLRYHLDVVGPTGMNEFSVNLPVGAVATAATLTVDGVKHRLALDASQHASEAFGAATAGPAGPHRRWAAQIAKGTFTDLDVSIVAPHAAVMTLDLEVDVATCFKHDRRMISVQAAWRGSIDHALKIASAGTPDRPDSPCTAATSDDDDASMIWIEMPTSEVSSQPFGERRIATIGNRLDVDHAHMARVEVDLASQISQIPPDLMTVFVIDASRSVSSSELEAQEKIIESYARLAPQSQIQVVAYSRKARSLLPGWMVASYAEPRLQRALATLATHNGSNLDTGLVEANKWLDHATGTRRVVVFTDERLGDRVAGIEPKVLLAALPAHTLVHVVALDGGTPSVKSFERDDNIALGHLAIDSEGLAVRAMTNEQFDALELLRPVALERVTIHSDGWAPFPVETGVTSCAVDGSLDLAEGDACVFWANTETKATSVKLEGLLWNHKFSRSITPAGQPRMLARILTGFTPALDELEKKEVELVAQAVNAQWSMIAAWGGSDGYADEDSTSNIYGSGCGCDSSSAIDMISGVGHVSIHGSRSIDDQITRATHACHVTSRVGVDIELTRDEIVEVAVDAADPSERACVTEAVWATPLVLDQPEAHTTANVVLLP